MATLPRPPQPTEAVRISQLERDGYVECVNNTWQLTDLGWRTLSAAAEPPVRHPVTSSRTQIEAELNSAMTLLRDRARFFV